MNLDTRKFAAGLPLGISATLLVGENGSGKSRFLVNLAHHYKRIGRSVVVISNTPYDRFIDIRGIKRISATWGRTLPGNLLKQAIAIAAHDEGAKLNGISETLMYCGYDPQFSIVVRSSVKFDNISFTSRPVLARAQNLINFIEEVQNEIGSSQKVKLTNLSPNDLSEIVDVIELLIRNGGKIHRIFDFTNSILESSQNLEFAKVVQWENMLRRLGMIERIDVEIGRGGTSMPIQEASSGQLTLIASLVFLASSLPSNAVLLIDEPENSLHPQWQKEYLLRILNLLYLRQPTIVIASHAPIIISGAQLVEGTPVATFQAFGDTVKELKPRSVKPERESVEETLWEVFKTVTPKNNYVSENLVSELDRVASGEIKADSVRSTIDRMQEASFDPKQIEFFKSVMALAQQLEDNRNIEGSDLA